VKSEAEILTESDHTHHTTNVVLFDLDGTLIDHNYVITDTDIFDAIQQARDAGWLVGLSSDTSYETLRKWYEQFGMNGPIIAEKGAHVVVDHSVPHNEFSPVFRSLTEQIKQQFTEQDLAVWTCDPVSHLQSGEVFGQPGENVVLMNGFRRFSSSFFVRHIGLDGKYAINNELINWTVELARAQYGQNLFDEDVNYRNGLLITSEKGMNKRRGTLVLRNLMNIDNLVMIGNSAADYVGADIATHLAVGDADDNYKERALYIATHPITGGAAQALRLAIKE
jgi:hydroxymethylpyrimidine pyrophosphatase-like HAD family hydrolase